MAPRTHTLPSPSHRPAVPTLPRGCDAAELVPEPDPITPPARGRCSGRCWGSGGRGVAPRGRSAPFRSVPLRPGPARTAPHRTAPPGLRRVSTFRGEQRDGGRLASLRSLFVIYFISIFGVGGLTSPGHPTPVPPSRRGPLACPLCCLRDGAVGTPLRWGRLGAVFGRGGQARVQACLVATGDQTCPASRARRRTALWDTAPWHPHPNASPMGPLCPLSPLPHCLPGGI